MQSVTTDIRVELPSISRLGDAIEQALEDAPVADVLSILTGAFVSLTVELVRRQGHDLSLPIKVDGGPNRDITIHAPKTESCTVRGNSDMPQALALNSPVRNFEVFWSNFLSQLDRPVSDSARLTAASAWNGSIDAALAALPSSDSEIRLMGGEMTSGELRTTKAILGGCISNVQRLKVSAEDANG